MGRLWGWVSSHPRLVTVPGSVVIGGLLAGRTGAVLVGGGVAVGVWWVLSRVPDAAGAAVGWTPRRRRGCVHGLDARDCEACASAAALGPGSGAPAVPVGPGGLEPGWRAELVPIGTDPVTGRVRYMAVFTHDDERRT